MIKFLHKGRGSANPDKIGMSAEGETVRLPLGERRNGTLVAAANRCGHQTLQLAQLKGATEGQVAELAYAHRSGRCGLKVVRVQLPPCPLLFPFRFLDG